MLTALLLNYIYCNIRSITPINPKPLTCGIHTIALIHTNTDIHKHRCVYVHGWMWCVHVCEQFVCLGGACVWVYLWGREGRREKTYGTIPIHAHCTRIHKCQRYTWDLHTSSQRRWWPDQTPCMSCLFHYNSKRCCSLLLRRNSCWWNSKRPYFTTFVLK